MIDPTNPIVISMEDDLIHIPEFPFCADPSCSCHEDPTLIEEVQGDVEAGLLTPDEATSFISGITSGITF